MEQAAVSEQAAGIDTSGACATPAPVIIYNTMVVDTSDDTMTDAILHALADATRRDIVRRAVTGEHSVSALARHYPMSVTAVQKHVEVLVRAGLVTKHRRGREQRVLSDLRRLETVQVVLAQLEATWRDRVRAMDHILAEDQSDQSGGRS